MSNPWRLVTASIMLAGATAACGGQASSGTASTATPSAIPSATATASASPAASASPLVLARTVGSDGTILVAASNGMTLYTFASDSPGVSTCKGGCATVWPPLTVPTAQNPTGGAPVTGALATITRDDGSLQLTYKGLPLYFFHKDTRPGDTLGHYPGWNLVKP